MARVVSTADEFRNWLKRERNILEVVYFTGNLAEYRKKAGRIEAALRRKAKRSHREAYLLEKIDCTLGLCDEAQWHERHGNVLLTQKRGGSGWVYLARRRTGR